MLHAWKECQDLAKLERIMSIQLGEVQSEGFYEWEQ